MKMGSDVIAGKVKNKEIKLMIPKYSGRRWRDSMVHINFNEKSIGNMSLLTKSPSIVEIHGIELYSYYRNKGIGSVVLQAIEKYLKQNGYNIVQIQPTYQSLGFWLKKGYKLKKPLTFEQIRLGKKFPFRALGGSGGLDEAHEVKMSKRL